METWIKEMFGDNLKASNTIARIVNEKHFSRLKSLLTYPKVKESLVYGGSMDISNLGDESSSSTYLVNYLGSICKEWMGRDITYDCWSCDLLCAASSPDLYRINLEQLEEGEDFIDVLNPSTKKETPAYGDSNM
ncbi:unnamed protein product [Lupinus luteus]|uniref:Uncharacterized protein n=1 Tax=Lupinus luteus TaxID=3873 RepID=A0AAV1WGI6_LUPLU